MAAFWEPLVARYQALGGELRLKTKVTGLTGSLGAFCVTARRGEVVARQVVITLPLPTFLALAPETVARRMRHSAEGPYAAVMGGVVLCLGVPATEVEGQLHRHHQLLQSYGAPLGDGNDMFISVSAPDDRRSAPPRHRAVMISTHSALGKGSTVLLTQASGQDRGGAPQVRAAGLPGPRHAARVRETGTLRAYARFARRSDWAVGGICLSLATANLRGVPHASGVRGLHLAGECTWPWLATVACLIGSALVGRRAAQRLTMCAVLEGRMVYQLR